MTDPFQRDVVAEFPRRHDMALRVSRVEVEETTYVDVREWIPSLQQYGRGVLIPQRLGEDIALAISEATKEASDVPE